MPLPIVHLKVAVHYLEQTKQAEQTTYLDAYYLGNIAPDSIHMREGWTREDKNKTHLFPAEQDYFLRLERGYNQMLARAIDPKWQWFIKGYFMHLLTDYYWFKELYPWFTKMAEQDQVETDLRTIYYRETDQLDFNLLRQEAWASEVWETLRNASGLTVEGLLSADEITKWKDRTIAFFEDPAKEPKITPKYFTFEEVDAFVVKLIPRLISHIHDW